jgi:RNA polymerase sigma-70 factor (ECF subfamily)
VATDLELLDAWADGDRDAGDVLIDRHLVPLYRFFRNKVQGGVHDLVQETFLRCSESRPRFRGRSSGRPLAPLGSFRSFVFGVARRVLHDHLRKHYRHGVVVDFGDVSVAALGTTPSQLVARREEHRVLLHALRMIPLDDQIALELAYWEELPGPEIAAVLGVSHAAARTRLSRARKALAERVRELCDSPELVESTLANLDGWAAAIREVAQQGA